MPPCLGVSRNDCYGPHAESNSQPFYFSYDLPMVEEGEPEPEFEAILDIIDPNRDGQVRKRLICLLLNETLSFSPY